MAPNDNDLFSMNGPWAHNRVWVSDPPREVKKNMVDGDRTIQMGEKMDMHVLNNITQFNNQKSLIMFTYIDPEHKQTHNTFLVTY